MSTVPTRAYLLARVEELQKQIEAMPEFQWGSDDDYPVETILMWRQTFGRNSRRRNEYTFVAIKTGRNKWRVRADYLTWTELVIMYLDDADDRQVFKADHFTAL